MNEALPLNTNVSPLRTYLVDYADELGIASASPTRQHLRRSQSTTMDRIRNQANAYGQSTTLEDIARRKPRHEEGPKTSAASGIEGNGAEKPVVSFLSRDGDVMTCSGISMSTPDFAIVETMPPLVGPREPPLHDTTVMPTQPLSEYENSLQVLIQPPVSDGLPSTKPSSDNLTTNTTEKQSTGGTQDDLAAAAQIGDDLLANMLDPRFAENGIFANFQQQDGSQDELAQGPLKTKQSTKTEKLSRKRTRSALEEEAEGSKPSKQSRRDPDPDNDLFAGIPIEHYQPRKSRSRATELDSNEFAEVDSSKRSAAKKKDSKHKVGQKKTTGGAVKAHVDDDDDIFEEIEQEVPIPAKSRAKKNGRTIKGENLKEVKGAFDMNELSQLSMQSSGSGDAVIAVAVNGSQEDGRPAKTKQKNSSKAKKQSKKSTTKQELVEHGQLPEDDEPVANSAVGRSAKSESKRIRSVDSSNSVDIDRAPFRATTQELVVEEHNEIAIEEQEPHQSNSQAVSQKDTTTDLASEPSEEKCEPVPGAKKTRGKGKNRARSKKSTTEIVTLASTPHLTPVLETEKQVEPDQTAATDGAAKDDHEPSNQELPLHQSQEAEAQALSDKTNLALPDKPVTPEKPASAPVHSPLKNARVGYRVGLSRNTRIEPLLKSIRKEKDAPKDSGSKKKKKT